MKIAVIAPSEIPARRANTMQVMKMTQAFCMLGHTVRLAAPTSKPSQVLPPDAAHNWAGLARHYGLQCEFPIDWLPAHSRMRRYDFSIRALQWARAWEAEIVFTRLPQSAAIASAFGQATIYEIHDLPQGRLGPWLFRLFLRGRGACRLVVITKALAEDLSRQFGAPDSPPLTVIAPDGVDLARYEHTPGTQEARLRLNQNGLLPSPLQAEQFIAGYTGHLYPGRGSELLIELAARLPEILFLVVGGELQDVSRFQDQVQARSLGNVIVTGFVPNADLPCYQAACDVLLMPYQSRVEASSGGDIARYLSPMKLFEYLACQRAIISSDLPVLQEVLNPQNAILLPANNPEAWIAALESLKSDPARRSALAAQARQDANRYTWESRAAKILPGPDKVL